MQHNSLCSEKSFCELKLNSNETLTLKSLKGWIRIPNGNLDFCRRELDSGIFVKVHLKILEQKHHQSITRIICINHFIFIPSQTPPFCHIPSNIFKINSKAHFMNNQTCAQMKSRPTDIFSYQIFLSVVCYKSSNASCYIDKHILFHLLIHLN
jgi:hypothetical protein